METIEIAPALRLLASQNGYGTQREAACHANHCRRHITLGTQKSNAAATELPSSQQVYDLHVSLARRVQTGHHQDLCVTQHVTVMAFKQASDYLTPIVGTPACRHHSSSDPHITAVAAINYLTGQTACGNHTTLACQAILPPTSIAVAPDSAAQTRTGLQSTHGCRRHSLTDTQRHRATALNLQQTITLVPAKQRPSAGPNSCRRRQGSIANQTHHAAAFNFPPSQGTDANQDLAAWRDSTCRHQVARGTQSSTVTATNFQQTSALPFPNKCASAGTSSLLSHVRDAFQATTAEQSLTSQPANVEAIPTEATLVGNQLAACHGGIDIQSHRAGSNKQAGPNLHRQPSRERPAAKHASSSSYGSLPAESKPGHISSDIQCRAARRPTKECRPSILPLPGQVFTDNQFAGARYNQEREQQ
jgi:hypothetical protein